MENYEPLFNRDMIECAYAAGQLAQTDSDWDMVVANLVIGFRDATVATAEVGALSPAYTGSSQITPPPAAIAERNSSAAQGDSRLESREHYAALIPALVTLQRAATEMIDEAAREARRDGATWTEIGKWLGLGRTAAHKRYGRPSDMDDDTPSAI